MDALQERGSYDVYAPPHARTADPVPPAQQPVFFPVGPVKLSVLSLCTFGFYTLYWFYRSWRQMPGRPSGFVKATASAIFCPLTAYFLFREIERFDDGSVAGPRVPAAVSALCFLLMGGAGNLPDPFSLLGLLAFAPLLPVAQRVNRLNAALRPQADPNRRFSLANIAWAAIGGLTLLAAVAEMIWGEAG